MLSRVIVFAACLLVPASLGAQQTRSTPSAEDTAGVKAAVLDYVEGIYLADTSRIVRSVRPELAKRGYFIPQNQTAYSNEPMTYQELIGVARSWNAGRRRNPDTMPKEIQILDLLDQTASAKLVAQWGVDYFHLARYDGRWMIVNVLWQTPPK
jgi:Putative lumazine-binding